MRVLFDQGTPRGLAPVLEGHTVTEARAMGWEALSNGDLLNAAEAHGFDVLLTTDKNLRFQQNLATRTIGIVVLGNSRWRLIRTQVAQVAAAVNAVTPGSYTEVVITETP